MKRVIGSILIGLLSSAALAGEVGFVEDFALAEDRAAALQHLIPGTDDYYYYSSLHWQNRGEHEKVDALLTQWLARHNGKHTNRSREIANRQALLRYEDDPAKTYQHLQKELHLRFDHRREQLDKKSELPSTLDQKLISWEAFRKRHGNNTSAYENEAFELLAHETIDGRWRRDVLSRLTRPDIPNLATMIVKDLSYKQSRGFGSLNIHTLLSSEQLQKCAQLLPKLRNNNTWVTAMLKRLRPADQIDWQRDDQQREAYLTRLQQFTATLGSSYNSLKANSLYHLLIHNRNRGSYDRELFVEYLKLPRRAHYANRDYHQRPNLRGQQINFSTNYSQQSQLPPIGSDEQLVKEYLSHFFQESERRSDFATYIKPRYLARILAETRILAGSGDKERWYSLLNDANYYKQLRDRVDIDFAPTNTNYYRAEESVKLDLHIKNVQKLIVKVFEINSFNYYRTKNREVDNTIDLDGLVANRELMFEYKDPAIIRAKRSFSFEDLDKPGIYVIEFIGNGRSARSVIHKGKLRFIERMSIAGHIFTVLDENNKRLNDAAIWLNGKRYSAAADGSGEITIPYSSAPAQRSFIIQQGSRATLGSFAHKSESYRLDVGFYVDRESLLPGNSATLLVRPNLSINHTPAPLSILEKITLHITAIDSRGIASTQQVDNFKLHSDRESTYEFNVPSSLASLTFQLKAKTRQISGDKDIDLSDKTTFELNGVDKSDRVDELHLLTIDGNYYIDLLGRSGEARPHQSIKLVLRHRLVKQPFHTTLQSDKNGRVALGPLADINEVMARNSRGNFARWQPQNPQQSSLTTIHARAGEEIRIDSSHHDRGLKPSLFALRSGAPTADLSRQLRHEGREIIIGGLDAGNYSLMLKNPRREITIRVAAGEKKLGYVLGADRLLEEPTAQPIGIRSLQQRGDELTIQLRNSSAASRVHIFASRFQPAYSPFNNLDGRRPAPLQAITTEWHPSSYLTGRTIGDEYRYILERRYATKFPGNMLERPSLLLNPWAIESETDLSDLSSKGGGSIAGGALSSKRKETFRSAMGGRPPREGRFTNLNFLPTPSRPLTNLRPDNNGVITLPLTQFGERQHIHVVAVSGTTTAQESLSLQESPLKPKDLRLAKSLDSKQHFAEQREIAVIGPDAPLQITDASNAKLEIIDSLSAAYELYATIKPEDKHLRSFNFLLNWPQSDLTTKKQLYSEYFSHELNFFLKQKDPTFFAEVALPYIRNKKDKTFMDHYLLGNDLSNYYNPWEYARLNVAEKILLAASNPAKAEVVWRDISDLNSLTPEDIELRNRLFDQALQGSNLKTDRYSKKMARLSINKTRKSNIPMRDMALQIGMKMPAVAANKMLELKEEVEEELAEEVLYDSEARAERDVNRRKQVRRLYRQIEPTKEWVENNYYRTRESSSLVTNNIFWQEYARHSANSGAQDKKPFISTKLAYASNSFTEMILALAVLDLPFQSKKAEIEHDDRGTRLTPPAAAVAFFKEIKAATTATEPLPLLVNENFFRADDRYRNNNGERSIKYVNDEFLPHVVYGAQVVVTNPTAADQKLDLLLQIPQGAFPVSNGFMRRSHFIRLGAYKSRTIEYYFYFPTTGNYSHYPAHITKNGSHLGNARTLLFNVVAELSSIDTENWSYISQHGTPAQVTDYLKKRNLHDVELAKIAWRMRERAFFDSALTILRQRQIYDNTLWSYALFHRDRDAAREYLKHRDDLLNRLGTFLQSPLVDLDPTLRNWYSHVEFKPLVNQRAHQFSARPVIINNNLSKQYEQFLRICSYKPQLGDRDHLALSYYLLLQDRVAKALHFFDKVNPQKLHSTIQYDYMRAYLALYREDIATARSIATSYSRYPVDLWANKFKAIAAQLDEIEGKETTLVDKESRAQIHDNLATSTPALEFAVDTTTVKLSYQNIEAITVNYYKMDLELLFSRKPFVQQQTEQFSLVKPNHSARIELSSDATSHSFEIPAELQNANMMIEISGGGRTASRAFYANSLSVQLIENYGQLRITHRATGKPIAKAYIKVFARRGAAERFYKDGYSDLRGRFDYATVSNEQVDSVERFAILIISEEHGALIREVNPPQL